MRPPRVPKLKGPARALNRALLGRHPDGRTFTDDELAELARRAIREDGCRCTPTITVTRPAGTPAGTIDVQHEPTCPLVRLLNDERNTNR